MMSLLSADSTRNDHDSVVAAAQRVLAQIQAQPGLPFLGPWQPKHCERIGRTSLV